MSETIKIMQNRRSVRSFDDKEIPSDIIDNILKASVQSPSYAGGQHYSIITVDDPAKKEALVNFTKSNSGRGMVFIQKAPVFFLFVMDFSRIDQAVTSAGQQMKINDCLESILIGSVDVGIAAEALSTAAESYGLGTVVVGALRQKSQEIIDLFKLPRFTFPLLGVSVGYPSEKATTEITPRFSMNTMVHKNVYNAQGFAEAIKSYDNTMAKVYQSRGLNDLTWSKLMTMYYSNALNPFLTDLFNKQGFHF